MSQIICAYDYLYQNIIIVILHHYCPGLTGTDFQYHWEIKILMSNICINYCK